MEKITNSENPIMEMLNLYCEEFAHRLGYTKDSSVSMPRYLDKMIAKGHFRTGGNVNKNPVILKVFGDNKLFWRHVYPILNGAPVKGSVVCAFFLKLHTIVVLNRTMQVGAVLDLNEELMRISLRQRTAILTLGQLIDFFKEYG